jgi:hypothetical protein
MLESDPDVKTPAADMSGKEITVLANGPSFIDLGTKLQSNVPANVAITSRTRHGELTDLGNGILQYMPAGGNANLRDAFEFTVSTANNQILKRDTIHIIIENDSTNLPCNIYPVTDYVHALKQVPVLIDVTKNDIICGGSVTVSVFKPGNSFPPHFGSAEVQGNRILYSPGAEFEGMDKIMYKLTAAGDPSRTAYGIVYVSGDSVCSFRLVDDVYTYRETVKDSFLTLPVFSNDSLCQSMSEYQVSLSSLPIYGQASIAQGNILYKVPASASVLLIDHFDYKLCMGTTCKTARVNISLQKDSLSTCMLQAKQDSLELDKNDTSIKYLKVLENDSLCMDLSSLRITVSPMYGNSTLVNNILSYQRTSNALKNDSLKYEICDTRGCSSATVVIKTRE